VPDIYKDSQRAQTSAKASVTLIITLMLHAPGHHTKSYHFLLVTHRTHPRNIIQIRQEF